MNNSEAVMDERTLEALKASIRKWDANANVSCFSDARILALDCPLCRVFAGNDDDKKTWCIGCPVKEKTGFDDCRRTPYTAAKYAYGKRDLEDFVSKARAEADFLRSLLPEGETV